MLTAGFTRTFVQHQVLLSLFQVPRNYKILEKSKLNKWIASCETITKL